MRVKVELDNLTDRIEKSIERSQRELTKTVLQDSNHFIPLDTGDTKASGRAEQDKVTWNTSYSRKIYYGDHIPFRKEKNPNASARWFERAKAEKSKAWVEQFKEGMRK